jgi:hypothetical protein
MTTAAFDADRATGTLLFAHGGRATPVLNAVLGALALDPVAAEGSSPYLPFSGESSATWGAVLDHLSARGRELGISTSVTTRDGAQLLDWLSAFATHVGARPADVKALLGNNPLALDDQATVEDLVSLAKLLDDGHGLHGYRIEEYSVNVSDGQCTLWNPFDFNFATQAAAEEAAEEFLRDDEYTIAVIGKVVIVDNEFLTDDSQDNLATIRREDLQDLPAKPAP